MEQRQIGSKHIGQIYQRNNKTMQKKLISSLINMNMLVRKSWGSPS